MLLRDRQSPKYFNYYYKFKSYDEIRFTTANNAIEYRKIMIFLSIENFIPNFVISKRQNARIIPENGTKNIQIVSKLKYKCTHTYTQIQIQIQIYSCDNETLLT